MSTVKTVFLKHARLSFPNLAEPQKRVNEQTGETRISYNCEFILTAEHPGYREFMETVKELAVQKWAEHTPTVLNLIKGDRKTRCFGVGSEKVNKKTFRPYDGYAEPNAVFISAGAKDAPQIIGADGRAIDPANVLGYKQAALMLYGGCYVNAVVKPWVQENKHGRGVRCDLVAIQFAAEGDAFGEGPIDVSGMFQPVAAVAALTPASNVAAPAWDDGMPF